MSVKLYGMAGSPNVRGVMLGLAEKGVSYEMITVLPPSKDPHYVARNPFGRAPLSRMMALCSTKPQPSCIIWTRPFRAQHFSRQMRRKRRACRKFLASSIAICSNRGAPRSASNGWSHPPISSGLPNFETVEAALPLPRRCAEALEALIAPPYLTGETFSLADIRLMPHFDLLRLKPEGDSILADKGKLVGWFQRVRERPSAKKGPATVNFAKRGGDSRLALGALACLRSFAGEK
jgi:glutathione S-transferase